MRKMVRIKLFFLVIMLLLGSNNSFASLTTEDSYKVDFVTFFGQEYTNEDGYTMVIDEDGNIYVAGAQLKGSFRQAFVAKFYPNGTLVKSTFFGGSNHETPTRIEINNDGDLVIVGITKSVDFPTTQNAFSTTFSGQGGIPAQWECCGDGFLVIMTADTLEITYSSFIGGSDSDSDFGLQISSSGNIYVFAITDSKDYPITPDAYQKTLNGSSDVVIMKFSSDGTNLLYSTYLGGNHSYLPRNGLNGYVYALDSNDNIIVGGATKSKDFITTNNAMNKTYGGNSDGFITKMSADGTKILFSTFISGSEDDNVFSLKIDSQDNIVFAGNTNSQDFPITEKSIQSSLKSTGCHYKDFEDVPQFSISCGDMYIATMTSDGSLIRSTLLGGSSEDHPLEIALDSEGNIYLTALTQSDDLIISSKSVQSTLKGSWDGYFAKISAELSTIKYSSYFGTSGTDLVNAVRINSKGEIYLTGFMSRNEFTNIKTLNGYSGGWDMILIKLNPGVNSNSDQNGFSPGFEVIIIASSLLILKYKRKK